MPELSSAGYTLLVGKVLGYIPRSTNSTHGFFLLDVAGTPYSVSVNCDSNVLKVHYSKTTHEAKEVTGQLARLTHGRYDKGQSLPHALELNYPTFLAGSDFKNVPQNDHDDVMRRRAGESLVGKTMYIFGECWDNGASSTNKQFGFTHDRGIHNIHMNQGSNPPFASENAPHQDGAILFRNSDETLEAYYNIFQTQKWPQPSSVLMTKMLANAPNDSTDEWIQITNTGPEEVDISGWEIVEDNTFVIPAGTMLAAHSDYTIAKNLEGVRNVPDAIFPELALSNRSERVQLTDNGDRIVDNFQYGQTENNRPFRRKKDLHGIFLNTGNSSEDWEF